MPSEQIMNKAIAKAVAEAMRVAIQAMIAATGDWTQSMAGSKLGSPAMKQLTFNLEAKDRYNELKSFKLEANNVLSKYNSPQNEWLAMVKNWMGRKGHQYIKALTNEEENM